MTEGDAAAVARLTTQLGYPVEPVEQARRLADVLARTDDALLVSIDADASVTGWIHVRRSALLEESDLAVVEGLVVDESHRSQGVGAALLAAGEEWARRHGAATLVVRSRVTRERAHAFYRRHGFVERKRSVVLAKALR